MDAKHEHRDQFLIGWYDILWRNIDRSMTGMWQILAPITVVGTGLWAVGADYIPLWLGGSAILLIIIWAVNLTIDLNSWHRRNLYLLTTVERHFLDPADYGTIIPREYRTPKRSWAIFYVVHGWTFGTLLVLSVVYLFLLCWQREVHCVTWGVLIVTLLIGAALTVLHAKHDSKSEQKMHDQLFSGSANVS